MGLAVSIVRDETNHKARRAVADFLKIAEKRFAEVNKNDNERIVNSAIPKTPKRRHSLG